MPGSMALSYRKIIKNNTLNDLRGWEMFRILSMLITIKTTKKWTKKK